MSVDKKIMDRIKKLLAMSKDMASEHEAEIATRRLHSLLSQYNLSLVDLEEESEEEKYDRELFEEYNRPWRKTVVHSICRLNFCFMYIDKNIIPSQGRKRAYVIIGSGPNRMVATAVSRRVIRALELEARRKSKEIYGRKNTPYCNSFWNAAAERIKARCSELIKQAREGELQDSEGNTLPVLASIYDKENRNIQSYLNARGIRLKTGRMKPKSSNLQGVRDGDSYGRRVSIHTELHQKKAPKLIGGGK